MSRIAFATLVALIAGAAVLVQPAAARPTPETGESPDGLVLLSAAARATYAEAYSGEQQVVVGGRGVTVDVRNWPGARVELSVRGRADSTVVEPSPPVRGGQLGELDGRSLALLARHYRVAVAGSGTVAGRSADVVEIRRRSGGLAARLWIDSDTKLPLRRVVLDETGRTVRSSTFTSVRYGEPAGGWSPVAPVADDGTALGGAALGRLRAAGWPSPPALAGLDLVAARRAGGVVQLDYSDGLSDVSVFEQAGHLPAGGPPGWTAAGAVWTQAGTPARVCWSAGGRTYTVVGADTAAVDGAVGALPHGGSGHRDVLSRLGHGLERVGSWFNPFD